MNIHQLIKELQAAATKTDGPNPIAHIGSRAGVAVPVKGVRVEKYPTGPKLVIYWPVPGR